MKHIRKIALCLALMLALTGMGGVVYAEGEPDALSGGSTDPPEALSEAPPEEGEEITEEAAETVTDSPEAASGEEPPAEDAAEESNEEPAEETDAPEAENAAEEAPAPQFAAVEAPAEPTLTQISVTWSEDSVEFIVSDAQRWNAEDLCWETDPERNGEITIAEGSNGKTFTVVNESGEALAASVTFAPDENLPEALRNAYTDVSLSCDPIPAGQTVSGTATVNFDFTAVRLTDDTVTGGTLGSFTLQFTKEVTMEENGNDPENPE